jgi:hypothetical protein
LLRANDGKEPNEPRDWCENEEPKDPPLDPWELEKLLADDWLQSDLLEPSSE